jgi:hypothetical protein
MRTDPRREMPETRAMSLGTSLLQRYAMRKVKRTTALTRMNAARTCRNRSQS